MAYGASSAINFDKGIIAGGTEVDEKNKQLAKELMREEFHKAASGKITKKGFREAKAHFANTRAMTLHTKKSITLAIEASVLRNMPELLDNYENAFDSVTYEDVLEAAKLIQDTPITYCLLQKESK
jgi:predicted Zn-dependent peptidase